MTQEVAEEAVETLPGKRRQKRRIFGGMLLLLMVLLAIAWWQRTQIADKFVQDTIAGYDVEASYEIDNVGIRTQSVKNLVLGDPDNPDLTVRSLEVDLSLGFSGVAIQWIRAKGVRLRGKLLEDGTIQLGELDKFLDPESEEPFRLPDFALDLEDASASLATPWGNLGIALEGFGQLRGQFNGEAALRSPSLAYQGCNLRGVRFDGELLLDAEKPQLIGPLQADMLRCPQQDLAATRPLLDTDLTLNETFDRWVGNVGFKAQNVALAGQEFIAPAGTLDVSGGIERSLFQLTVDEAGYRGDPLKIRQMALTGEGRMGLAEAGFSLAMRGNAEIAGGSIDPSLVSAIDDAAASSAETPVGPLLERLGPAARAALNSFDAGADFDFAVPARAAAKIDITGLDIATQSGARLRQSGALRLETRGGGLALVSPVALAFDGGGLPEGRLALRRSGAQGWAGRLSLSPYASGNARLALTDFDFSGNPGGSWRFGGNAVLSGPLPGGRIDGLRLPVDGRWDGRSLSMLSGCRQLAFDRAAYAGLDLGAHRFNLCPQSESIVTSGPSGTSVNTRIPSFAMKGRLGGTPIDLKAATVRFSLDEGFNARNVDVALGAAGTETAFSADALDGRFDRRGMVGTLSGGAGKIANVPLLMSEAGGDWSYRNGDIRLVASLAFADEAEQNRFFPMQVPEIIVDYIDGTITAIGDIVEPKTGTRIADADIRHELATNEGRALISVDDLSFTDAFQPEMVTPLTLGVIANVKGDVFGDARIEWDNSEDGIVSTGRFGTNDMDLAAAFGPVRGLKTEMAFTDLLFLETAPAQIATIQSINPGVEALGGLVKYRLLADQQVQIEGGEWPFAGGQLILEPTIWDLGVETDRNLVLRVRGVQVGQFVEQFDFDNLTATGVFDGVLPMTFDADGGRIIGGELIARPGGGNISYIGELTYEDLSPYADFAFDALRSLDYNGLRIGMNGDLGGEIITVIQFEGIKQGEGARRNFVTRQLASIPIKFNIVVEAEFFKLFGSIRSIYDPEYLVQRNLPLLLREQQEAARRKLEQDGVATDAETATEQQN